MDIFILVWYQSKGYLNLMSCCVFSIESLVFVVKKKKKKKHSLMLYD